MSEYLWVFLILVYGIFKGMREALKKKAMETNSVLVVLFFYTLFAFIFVLPFSKGIFEVNYIELIIIFFKSFIIFIAWLCALNSIKRLPLSAYSVMDMARVVFSILLGVIFLRESIALMQAIGIVLVLLGVFLVNLRSHNSNEEKPEKKVYFLVAVSCILNAVSGILDKWLLSSPNDGKEWLISRSILGDKVLTSSQLQFWYMLFLTILYGILLLIKREKFDFKKTVLSPWIWILSLLFIVADRCLFIANSDPNSTVVVMTLIKQSSVLVSIFLGKFLFKEKHIVYRIMCALLIIAGIVISVY